MIVFAFYIQKVYGKNTFNKSVSRAKITTIRSGSSDASVRASKSRGKGKVGANDNKEKTPQMCGSQKKCRGGAAETRPPQ